MPLSKKIKRAASLFAAPGGLRRAIWRHRANRRDEQDFARWIAKYDTLDDEARARTRSDIEKLAHQPLISVLIPVYDVDERWLRLAIGSVRKQIYPHWELCVADDCSPSPHVRRVLEEFAAADERIKITFRAENGHISAASNSALELATGEFAVLLDHDDELSEDALFRVANELNAFPETEMIYSDEDTIDEDGRRYFPRFKPDFARDLFYSINLVTHLSAYRTSLLRQLGGFRIGFEGSQDYDLALRAIEQIPESHIRHIPRILYHWRAIRTSAAQSSDAKPYAYERAREALRKHFTRAEIKVTVEPALLNLNRVRYTPPDLPTSVSLIVFGDGADSDSEDLIRSSTNYPDLEIVKAGATASAFNDAASRSTGEILCFLDGDLRPLGECWLRELVSFADQHQIGAVGAKLLKADGTIGSTGLIIGQFGTVGPAHHGLPRNEHGNFVRAQLIGNYSAVPAACLAVRRELFEAVGGFDDVHLENRFFDADLCLRLLDSGYRIVYTPYAELAFVRNKKNAAASRVVAEEYEYFCAKWHRAIERDPFYNPNFAKRGPAFRIKS